jgi:hypothetical protein
MNTDDPRTKNLRPGRRPGEPRPNAGTAKLRRMTLFAQRWTGNLDETVALCREDGLKIGRTTGDSYIRDPRFVDLLRQQADAAPTGSGVWTREQIQRYLTRVAAGIEPDGYDVKTTSEPILPGEADYDPAKGDGQMRALKQYEPRQPSMQDRLRGTELLGKSLGVFADNLQVNSQLSIVALLDDDLKEAKPVTVQMT